MNTEETKKCTDCLSDIPLKAKKCSQCGTKQKVSMTRREKIIATVLFGIIFLTFSGMLSGESKRDTPSVNTTPKVTANMTAIQSELDEYAEGRWSNVIARKDPDGILIRVTTGTEVTINETAASSYCRIIGEILQKHAPSDVNDADVFVYQYGEIVKACTY